MAGSFDPYREWLAIASGGPHSFYDLLGLRPLESDITKINTAFRRQSDRLALHLSGAQAGLAQRLMGELTEARMTLLTPTAKRAYDASLAAGQPTTPPLSPSDPKRSARWSGSPVTASDDSLLPPTAMPSTPMPRQTPSTPISSPTDSAQPAETPYPTPAVPISPYPAMQPAAGIPTAVPAYPYPAHAYPASGYGPQHYPQAYAQPRSPTSPQYGTAPVVAQAVVAEPAPQVSTFSASSYRAGRRRRSSAPLAAGVLLVALLLLGGVYWKIQADRRVASTGDPTLESHAAPSKSQSFATRSPKRSAAPAPRAVQPSPAAPPKLDVPSTAPEEQPMASTAEMPKPELPKAASPTESNPPTPEAPPKTDTATAEPDHMASPEEAAAVGRALKAARAALADRDFSLAQEQIDQATLEATAPDTMAEVERVELLAKYVEGFWEAARGTLGKLQAAEEIEIDGERASVVDASPEMLTLRVAGKNHEYTLDKLPSKIALYLAKRWLTPNDPATDVALAAFHMADPKGDRREARRLLQSAAARGIDVKPLLAELDMP